MYTGLSITVTIPPTSCGVPRRTGRSKTCSASSGSPSRITEPPVTTIPEGIISRNPDFSISRLASSRISSTRGCTISASTMRESVRFSRPPTEGTSMLSSGRTSEASAQPYLRLIFSASAGGVRSPTEMSFVTWLPPSAITEVCQMLPWLKIAMSVVPPPMSSSATPRFFSSSVSAA